MTIINNTNTMFTKRTVLSIWIGVIDIFYASYCLIMLYADRFFFLHFFLQTSLNFYTRVRRFFSVGVQRYAIYRYDALNYQSLVTNKLESKVIRKYELWRELK